MLRSSHFMLFIREAALRPLTFSISPACRPYRAIQIEVFADELCSDSRSCQSAASMGECGTCGRSALHQLGIKRTRHQLAPAVLQEVIDRAVAGGMPDR